MEDVSKILELRWRICTALAQWELGEGIAEVLPFSAAEAPQCRETVARFHHTHARVLCEKSVVLDALRIEARLQLLNVKRRLFAVQHSMAIRAHRHEILLRVNLV